MSTPTAPLTKDEHEDEGSQLSKGAAIFVMLVAFTGAILTTVDMFLNGWLAALAHLGWFIGVFLVCALILGLVLALVLGGQRAAHEAPAVTP
ncbi:hypothetical protein AB0J01_41415 [Streptomyces sp. NPDC050204]|uniref:hypothetical protein n=1 Tax=Streptomyces sp. NPDC050204 TaxID=3155514 RepID=UPI003422101C